MFRTRWNRGSCDEQLLLQVPLVEHHVEGIRRSIFEAFSASRDRRDVRNWVYAGSIT